MFPDTVVINLPQGACLRRLSPAPKRICTCRWPKRIGASVLKSTCNVWWPNIKGYFFTTGQEGDTAGGTFEILEHRLNYAFPAYGDYLGQQNISFSAFANSQLYSGSSVQPKAMQVLPCIRT